MATLMQAVSPLLRPPSRTAHCSLHQRCRRPRSCRVCLTGLCVGKIAWISIHSVASSGSSTQHPHRSWSFTEESVCRTVLAKCSTGAQAMRPLAPLVALLTAVCTPLVVDADYLRDFAASLESSLSVFLGTMTTVCSDCHPSVGLMNVLSLHLSGMVGFLSMLNAKDPFWPAAAGPSSERILCAASASNRQVLYMDSESSEMAGVGMGSNRSAGVHDKGEEEGAADRKPQLPDGQKGKEEEDWFLANDGLVRSMPLVAGGVGGCLVILNRVLSGVAPVADASSGQSRADVLSLALSATLLLTGLTWKSVQPKTPVTVQLQGVECFCMNPDLPARAYEELSWAWQFFQKLMRCRGMVVVYGGQCMMQAGIARQSESGSDGVQVVDAPALVNKPICGGVLRSGKANYFANLPLFPGRVEFDFLPINTQAVVVHPLGEEGLLILASDTVRGFRPIDQAWIATISEKIDSTLQDVQELQKFAPKPSQ